MTALRVGVDLGGTKLETVVVHGPNGGRIAKPIHRERVPTAQEQGYEAIVDRVASAIQRACDQTRLDARSTPLGVGMPGGVERKTGLVKNSNTTCLNGKPFREDLSARLCRVNPIVFDNDANCFALAETIAGAAREHVQGIVFGVIMGTGVGGGLIVQGRTWPGVHGIAGEWGHHAVYSSSPRACYCGQLGCVEPLLSGPALELRYQELTGKTLTVRQIARAAQDGVDAAASSVIEHLVDTFGRALANVIDILDPSAVVLGGGLSNLAVLYDRGRDRVARYLFNDELLTPILKNELGDSAGVLGAALLPSVVVQRQAPTPSPL